MRNLKGREFEPLVERSTQVIGRSRSQTGFCAPAGLGLFPTKLPCPAKGHWLHPPADALGTQASESVIINQGLMNGIPAQNLAFSIASSQ